MRLEALAQPAHLTVPREGDSAHPPSASRCSLARRGGTSREPAQSPAPQDRAGSLQGMGCKNKGPLHREQTSCHTGSLSAFQVR